MENRFRMVGFFLKFLVFSKRVLGKRHLESLKAPMVFQ